VFDGDVKPSRIMPGPFFTRTELPKEKCKPLPAEQWEDNVGQIQGMPEGTKLSNTV